MVNKINNPISVTCYKRGVFVLVKKFSSGKDKCLTFIFNDAMNKMIKMWDKDNYKKSYELAIFNEIMFANWFLVELKKDKIISDDGIFFILEILDQDRWNFVYNKLITDGVTSAMLNPCIAKDHKCPAYRFSLDKEKDFSRMKKWFSKCINRHYTFKGEKRGSTLLLKKPGLDKKGNFKLLEDNPVKRKPKVLIFEDDPFLEELYRERFMEAGFDTKSFKDGENSVRRVLKEKPDIIYCNIVMPSMNGWEVIALLQKNKRTKDIPIIIVSNVCEKEEVKKGLKLGAVRHCCKAQYVPLEIIDIFKNYLVRKEKFAKKDFLKVKNKDS